MSIFSNYFFINGYANKSILSFESWIVWQKLCGNDTIIIDAWTAKEAYTKEINKAIDWANVNDRALHSKLITARQAVNNLKSENRREVYNKARDVYSDMMNDRSYQENIGRILDNRKIIDNLVNLIPTIHNVAERAALETFLEALVELYKLPNAINPIRPIASGILDTSGVDSIWFWMQMKNDNIECLKQPPEEYKSIGFHGAIDTMCQELFRNCESAIKCEQYMVNVIDPICIPAGVREESIDVKLQVHAAFALLENLRQIWAELPARGQVETYNEGTYVVDIISSLFKGFKYGKTILQRRWAEESSEATSSRKPDMRMKLALGNTNTSLEILFLESSRPKAEVLKFIQDWIKLVRMCKRAHDKMFETIKSTHSRLERCSEGREILSELATIPIFLIQVHCFEVTITVLDWHHQVYHRVRLLENFEIPLKPPEDSEKLRDFVCIWLRLQTYVDNVSSQLLRIWDDADKCDKMNFFTRSSTPPRNPDASSSTITRTPESQYFFNVGQRR